MSNLLVVVATWATLALVATVFFSRVQVLGKKQARLVRSHRRPDA